MNDVELMADGQVEMLLTPEEMNTRVLCEAVIAENMKGFLQVGSALCVMRDNRLWRSTHRSFEHYCEDRWEIGRAYASQIISSTSMVEEMAVYIQAKQITGVPLPANEGQARPLKKLPVEERVEVMEAVAAAGPVTAAAIKEEVAKRLPEPEPEPEVPFQTEIPTEPEPKSEPVAIATPAEPATELPPYYTVLLPADEYQWLLSQGMTPATAIAELRIGRNEAKAAIGRTIEERLWERLDAEAKRRNPTMTVEMLISSFLQMCEASR